MKTQAYILIFLIALLGCKKETEISETAISIKDLRDIGELTTAEYYGEVIESLQENYIVSDVSHLQAAYERIRAEYSRIGRRYKWASRRVRKFRKTQLHDTDEYKALMKATKNFISFTGDRKFLEEEVWKKDWETFYADNGEKLQELVIKKNDKVELVYLGRGWVKAGYDLSKVDTSILEVERDTLFVRNFDPQIFNIDINPWFIPNREEGYELVRSRNEKQISFDQITLVKMACKERLRRDALDRGILDKARGAAEEIFTSFFSSLQIEDFRGEPFHYISITTTPLFEEKLEALYDYTLDSAEVSRLNFLIDEDTKFDSYELSVLRELDEASRGQANHPSWKELLDKAFPEQEN